MYKALLVLLFIAAVISLFSGLFYILRDRGGSARTVNALGWRVFFCVLLLAAILYGIATGELLPNQPWPV